MSQVQNHTLHNFVQPALFIGTALLAGRYIERFPGASQRGLLLSASLGAGVALVSQKWASDNETLFVSFMRVTASLALGTILSPTVSKTLKGRAAITLPTALRFFAVETLVAAFISGASSQITPQVKIDHDKYSRDLAAWQALEEKQRDQLAKQFYQADLPPLTFEDAKISEDLFDGDKQFSTLSKNRLLWHRQMQLEIEELDLHALGDCYDFFKTEQDQW